MWWDKAALIKRDAQNRYTGTRQSMTLSLADIMSSARIFTVSSSLPVAKHLFLLLIQVFLVFSLQILILLPFRSDALISIRLRHFRRATGSVFWAKRSGYFMRTIKKKRKRQHRKHFDLQKTKQKKKRKPGGGTMSIYGASGNTETFGRFVCVCVRDWECLRGLWKAAVMILPLSRCQKEM